MHCYIKVASSKTTVLFVASWWRGISLSHETNDERTVDRGEASLASGLWVGKHTFKISINLYDIKLNVSTIKTFVANAL